LLDDQWALVEVGAQQLSTYLALAAAMGDRLEERAWTQITTALALIEYDERGTEGHDAFAAYARSILKPVAERLGWTSKPNETPGIQNLRRVVLEDLGDWGDPQTISEARKRFAAFLADRGSDGRAKGPAPRWCGQCKGRWNGSTSAARSQIRARTRRWPVPAG
jgi:hypothetical protein